MLVFPLHVESMTFQRTTEAERRAGVLGFSDEDLAKTSSVDECENAEEFE